MIKVNREQAEKILNYLLRNGGDRRETNSPYEVWRVRFSDAVFTYYTNETLSFTDPKLRDPAVLKALDFIQEVAGPFFTPPSRPYLIGLDEAGKGEMFGHVHLAGVMIHEDQFRPLTYHFVSVDTKKKLILDNWNKLASFVSSKAGIEQDSIPPWDVDRFNLNELLDITYQRILNRFFREVPIELTRIVIDDYGVGPLLERFLNFLQKSGAEVVVMHQADEQYLESKLASVIARTERERFLHAIRTSEEFNLGGIRPGSGNPADPQTQRWLEAWPKGKPLPWFVRKSWKPLAKYHPDQSITDKKKLPALNHSLLGEEFRALFEQGHFNIKALSVVCPHCGAITKECRLAFDGEDRSSLRCSNCNEPIPLLANTLRYYCGYAVVDTNALIQKAISRDLTKRRGRNFRNFKVHVPFVAKLEAGNQSELDQLKRHHQLRHIHFTVGGPEELPEEHKSRLEHLGKIPGDLRDELILDVCERLGALLVTADKGMRARASTRGIFCVATR